MIELNNESIREIKSILSKVGSCPLFALEYKKEKQVILTNGSALFCWPRDLVKDCPQYSKLLDAQKDQNAATAVERLKATHWYDFLFHPDGKFMNVIEQEPTQEELAEMKRLETIAAAKSKSALARQVAERYIVYTTTRAVMRVRYNCAMLEASEYVVEGPVYRMYRPPKNQNIAQQLQMLGVYDGKELVGAFANMMY